VIAERLLGGDKAFVLGGFPVFGLEVDFTRRVVFVDVIAPVDFIVDFFIDGDFASFFDGSRRRFFGFALSLELSGVS
jgi:hypothetical protein